MIIFATLSPDLNFPGSSCILQKRLGVPGIATLDIRNQCTGFVYGLVHRGPVHQDGHDEPRARGGCGGPLGLDMTDRGRDVTVLFGDGAVWRS